MPPVKYAAGAQSPAIAAVHRSEYTDAQWRALPALKHTTPPLVAGAARTEFVNHVLLADGTISTDLDAVREATTAHDAQDTKRLDAFVAAHTDQILSNTLSRDVQRTLADLRYWAGHSQSDELADAIAQNRFLFIVDDNLVPRIYFQCVTPDNPEIAYVNPSDDPSFAQRQSARDSHEAARLARGG